MIIVSSTGVGLKVCGGCGKVRHTCEFNADNSKKDKLSLVCRVCNRERNLRSKETRRRNNRRYSAKPRVREARREYDRMYYGKNKEKMRKRVAAKAAQDKKGDK